MTWYAHHLFAEASAKLLQTLLENPATANGIYWVRDLKTYPWHDPKVRHELPPNGLLVIRPVADPSFHHAAWYKEPIISWFDLHGSADATLNIQPTRLLQDQADYSQEDLPPPAFLEYLKQLSLEKQAALAFYHSAMWGGDTELEYAWVLKDGKEVAYSGMGFREFPNLIREYREDGTTVQKQGYVLPETLSHLSVRLPTPFFALHTRSFPWESYKVKASPAT